MINSVIILLINVVMFFYNINSYGDYKYDNDIAPIIIEKIYMGPMQGDSDSSEFSLKIKFINKKSNINQWKLGFFLAGAPLLTFVKNSQKINPKIVMQICNEEHHCTKLKYEKSDEITNNDLSQGYTTILSPINLFPLIKGKNYIIKINHINQWGGANISYFPQNFFFISTDKGYKIEKVYSIKTSFNTYNITNYNQNIIDDEISNNNLNNWGKSNNYYTDSNPVVIVPTPAQVHFKNRGYYEIKNNIVIENQFNKNSKITKIIIDALKLDLGVNSSIKQKNLHSGIIIQKLEDPDIIKNNPEGYVLVIDSNLIKIKVLNEAGIYYAFQTLRQLWFQFQKQHKGHVKIPQLKIIDFPRFKYRGILLDTARNFFTVSEIKSLVNLMGTHKLNTLHLHLSDDEAFRIALPFYPALQSIGNKRGLGLKMGPMMFPQSNLISRQDKFVNTVSNIYKGSYTIDDILEIKKYANLHQITIIPEIDLPSHSRALIKSLPNIFVDPQDKSKYVSDQGYTDNILPVCTYNTNVSVGAEFTKTINDIIHKVIKLFNEQSTVYAIENEVSLGGDEVSLNAWTESPSCVKDWKNLNTIQKSHKFFKEVSKINPDIYISGWQQLVLDNNNIDINNSLSASRVGHIWVWDSSQLGVQRAANLANKNYPTVLAFSDKTYFDLVYTPDISEPGFAWATKFSNTNAALSSADSITKVQMKTNNKYKKNVLGLEGALWSEHILNYKQLVYMTIPKMSGLSEASWTPVSITFKDKKLNWQSLAKRLGCGNKGFLSYLNKIYGVRYRGYPEGIKLEVPKTIC